MKKRGHPLAWALTVAAGLWLIWRARSAVKLVLIALFVANLADLPTSRLQPRLGRAASALLVTMGTLAAVALALGAVLVPAAAQLSRLPFFAQQAGMTVARLATDNGIPWEEGFLPSLISRYGSRLMAALAQTGAALGTGLARLAAVCALTVFFLIDWERLSLRLALLVPSRWRTRAVGASRAMRRDLGTYLRGQLTVMATVSLLTVIVLFAARAPMPLAMGVMYGALNAVPYVGPLLATVPPVVAALAYGWKSAVMTLILLIMVQQIDNYVISPRVLGAASGMGPAMVLLSLALGSALAGVWGMFLALPAAVSARAVYRAFIGGAEESDL